MAECSNRKIALLALHPRHARAILDGKKQVELRRSAMSTETTHVIVYATSPIQAILGWFKINGIESDDPGRIWELYGQSSGVSINEFDEYFYGADRAYAILIGESHKLTTPISLQSIPSVKRAPQSFQYVDDIAADQIISNRSEQWKHRESGMMAALTT